MSGSSGIRALLRATGVDLRRREFSVAMLFFLHCFLLGSFQYAAKTVRQSTFVDALGAERLPWVYLLVAVVAYPVIRLYAAATERWRLQVVVMGTSISLAVGTLAFAVWFAQSHAWIPVAFYLWASIASVLAMSQFWSFAADVFDPRQARRLFGFMSAGGLLGAVAGGQLPRLVGGDPQATLVMAAALLFAIALLTPVTEGGARSMGRTRRPTLDVTARDTRGGFETIRSSRLLMTISALMVVSVIAAQVIDLQFNWIVEQRTSTLEDRTLLFGNVFSIMGLAAFLFQLVLTSRIHRSLGVGFAMRVLPGGLVAGTGLLLAATTFAPASLLFILGALKVGENGLRHSLDQSTRELLFVPVAERDRRKAKAYIDVLVQRFAKSVAAVLLLTVTFGLLNPLEAGWITVVACLAWLLLSYTARREYVGSLRQSLVPTAHVERELPEQLDLSSPGALEALVEAMGSLDENRALGAIDLLAAHGKGGLVPPLLLRHDAPAVRRRVLEVIGRNDRHEAMPMVTSLIADDDPDVRATAIRTLAQLSHQDAPLLMKARLHDADIRVRAAAVACLASQEDPSWLPETEAAYVELVTDGDAAVRVEAAQALAEIPEPRFQQHAVTLLFDREPAVLRAAVAAVQRRLEKAGPQPLYIPILISLLRHRQVKHEARSTLVGYGESVIPALVHFLNAEDEHVWVRRALPKTLARIGTASSMAALVNSLDANDTFLRRKVIEALSTMESFRFDKEQAATVGVRIEAECQAYLRQLLRLSALDRRRKLKLAVGLVQFPDDEEPSLLERLLAESMSEHVQNIFDLLEMLSDRADIGLIRRGLHSSSTGGHALEYLDNILAGPVRRAVLSVIDDIPLQDRIRVAQRETGETLRGRVEALRELALPSEHPANQGSETVHPEHDDAAGWIASAALYEIAHAFDPSHASQVAAEVLEQGSEIAQETAAWVLASLRIPTPLRPS